MNETPCDLNEEECLILSDFYADLYGKWREVKNECKKGITDKSMAHIVKALKEKLDTANSNMGEANDRRLYFIKQAKKAAVQN